MVGGGVTPTTRGAVLKGQSIRKVEDPCSNITVHLIDKTMFLREKAVVSPRMENTQHTRTNGGRSCWGPRCKTRLKHLLPSPRLLLCPILLATVQAHLGTGGPVPGPAMSLTGKKSLPLWAQVSSPKKCPPGVDGHELGTAEKVILSCRRETTLEATSPAWTCSVLGKQSAQAAQRQPWPRWRPTSATASLCLLQ